MLSVFSRCCKMGWGLLFFNVDFHSNNLFFVGVFLLSLNLKNEIYVEEMQSGPN